MGTEVFRLFRKGHRKMNNIKIWIVAGSLCAIAMFHLACTTGSYQDNSHFGDPLNDRLTQTAFRYEGPLRNPVIVIHGLLGARLANEKGETVWGNFSPAKMAAGTHFQELAHPMKKGIPLTRLKNDVVPTGLLEQSEVSILGVQFSLDNYEILINALKRIGYVPEGKVLPPEKHFPSLFVFYYDWRRDISENAAELHKFIQLKREMLRKQYSVLYGKEKEYDIQFDLAGHSMGGLLARYYLRYGGKILPDDSRELDPPDWSGAKYVDKVLIIGTPNAGYADTLLELKNGLRLVPGSPVFPPALIGTFLSYYEMLPAPETGMVREKKSGAPIDVHDPAVWEKYRWGLADPEQDSELEKLLPEVKTPEERRAVALDHLRKALAKARQFHKAMSFHATEYPPDVSVWLIAGNTVWTNAVLEVDEKGKITVAEQAAGDGKITFASCCQDLRASDMWQPYMDTPINWKAVYPVPGGHMGIMNGGYFDAILRHLLLDVRNPDNRKRRD